MRKYGNHICVLQGWNTSHPAFLLEIYEMLPPDSILSKKIMDKLEREEKKLELEIKKAAKTGNKQATTVLAKQLIQLRKQKTRTFTAQSQIRGAKNQAHAMGANAKLAETMVTFMCPSAKLI